MDLPLLTVKLVGLAAQFKPRVFSIETMAHAMVMVLKFMVVAPTLRLKTAISIRFTMLPQPSSIALQAIVIKL